MRNLKEMFLFEDNDLKITFNLDKISIINYTKIDHLNDNKVIINYLDKLIIIKGKSLSVTKLLDEEILLIGNINSIEIGDT